MALTVGLDLGQRTDPSALVVAEYDGRKRAGAERIYTIRELGRLPLGTSYPDVALTVVDVVRQLNARVPKERPTLLVDATGVGRPVVDILSRALKGVSCRLYAVTFTHGDRFDRVDDEYKLGKAYLVSTLQALLQTKRIKLPPTPWTEVLVRELADYEIRIDENANDKYGAFAVGTHDDLVTALGLACCYGESPSALPFQGEGWSHSDDDDDDEE